MIASRNSRTEEIELDSTGVEACDTGIGVDDHCRSARMDGPWAVAPLTGEWIH